MKKVIVILLVCLLSVPFVYSQETDPACTELEFSAHMSDGLSAYESPNYTQARFHFECAIQLNPDNALAHRRLGDVLFDSGQIARAIGVYGTYRDIAGNETEAYVLERLEQHEVGLEEIGLIIVGVSSFLLVTCAPVLFVVWIIYSVMRKRPEIEEQANASRNVTLTDEELLEHAEQFYYEVNLLKYREVEYPLFNDPDGWREFVKGKDFLGLWIALKSTPADILREEDIDINKHWRMMTKLEIAMKAKP